MSGAGRADADPVSIDAGAGRDSAAGRLALGIDIGGTKIVAGSVDPLTGAVASVVRVDTPRSGGELLLSAVLSAARDAFDAAPNPVGSIGVGTAGVVVDDLVVSANSLLPGWASQPLAATLRSTFRLPVVVRNDVHAAALAESRFGAAAGSSRTLVVSVGTGIGGALVVDGEVAEGPHGNAGSIGHVPVPVLVGASLGGRVCACGALDHLEAYAGGRSIEERWASLSGKHSSLRELAGSIEDAAVRAHIVEAGALLGKALAGAASLLDLDTVVLGGGVVGVGPVWVDAVREGLASASMRDDLVPSLRLAVLGEQAALVGAALAGASAGDPAAASPGGRTKSCR